MEIDFLNDLNPTQQKAAKHIHGPSLIIAGAGSGKTRVLTYRIAYMLSQEIPAHAIMALTFTNKAAAEMKERISLLVGGGSARKIWMGTFHSIFYKILRMNAEKIGFPNTFTIYDTEDSKSLVKKIIKELNFDDKIYKPNEIYNRISQAKNNLITASTYASNSVIISQDRFKNRSETYKIYEIYSSRCKTSGVMDFDDLLLYTNILFRDNPDVLEQYQNHFQYFLVDEYQDTNYAQYLIMKKLAAKNKNICVVGDDAQSIYSFRGAKIENILNYKNDYPEYTLHKLEQNYRSTQNIVNSANSLIAKNNSQIPKKVFSKNDEGEKILVYKAQSDIEEGFIVAKKVLDVIEKEKFTFSEIAILYRTNAQSRVFEEAFRKFKIPYRIYGGLSFYQRKEIKDVLAYFRLIMNPKDNEALKRVINIPGRGIGKTTIDRLEELAATYNISIWEVVCNIEVMRENFNGSAITKIHQFAALIQKFGNDLPGKDAFELANDILEKTAILKEYEKDTKADYENRKQNIEELINSIHEYCTQTTEETGVYPVTLDQYVQNVSLLTDADKSNENENNTVSLMTVHSAKGLEYNCVFVVGVEKEFFPLYLNSSNEQEVEEERRLFYVAITRAKQIAVVSFAQSRMKWGQTTFSSPSTFIKELGEEHLQFMFTEVKPDVKPNLFDSIEKKEYIKKEIIPKSEPKGFERNNLKPMTKSLARPIASPQTTTTATNATPAQISTIQPGMLIEHERFGKGMVSSIEGVFPDIKAEIIFENAGTKILLLKFAKLKIINNN